MEPCVAEVAGIVTKKTHELSSPLLLFQDDLTRPQLKLSASAGTTFPPPRPATGRLTERSTRWSGSMRCPSDAGMVDGW